MERTGITKMKGNPVTLVGNILKIGDNVSDFTVLTSGLAPKRLADFEGKVKLISVTPSLDTPVCDAQLHWFNEEAAKQPGDVVVINVSMDLPFAIKRFCATEDIDRVETLSDHRDASFGNAFGVLMKELRLLARSLFVVDRENVVRYIQIVPEQTEEPNYEEALEALKKVL